MKPKGKPKSKKRKWTAKQFHEALFTFQPHEIINPIFDYFSAALNGMDSYKVSEFFEHFESGVRGQMSSRKLRGVGIKKEEKGKPKSPANRSIH